MASEPEGRVSMRVCLTGRDCQEPKTMTIKENGEDVSVCAHCALNNAGEQHFAVSNSKLWQDPAQSRGEPPRGFTYDMGTQPRK